VLTVDQDNRCEHVADRIHTLPIGYHVDHTQHNRCLLKPKLKTLMLQCHYNFTDLSLHISYIKIMHVSKCAVEQTSLSHFCSFYLFMLQEAPSKLALSNPRPACRPPAAFKWSTRAQ